MPKLKYKILKMPFPRDLLSEDDEIVQGLQNVYAINREYLLVQGAFTTLIQEYDEEFSFHMWVKIEGESFNQMLNQKGHTRTCKGVLLKNLTFHDFGKGEIMNCIFQSTNDPVIIPTIVPLSMTSRLFQIYEGGIAKSVYNGWFSK